METTTMTSKQTSTISRRHLLRSAAGLSLGFAGLRTSLAQRLWTPHEHGTGYGDLIADPNGIIDLPSGFSYHVFSRVGETMDDGLLVPGDHDGMATFPGPDGKTIIVRNHELSADEQSKSAFGANYELLGLIDQDKLYDAGGGTRPAIGGTTTLVYDTENKVLEKHFLSLVGTCRNCAGGPTPWGTWISCEENVSKAGGLIEKDHGFNFEVPAMADSGLVDPVPLTAMGRFNHEAVAVDPASGIVYQTEDRDNGLIYRYIPDQAGQLALGGRLQALVIRDLPSAETRNWTEQLIPPGQPMTVGWIDLDEVLSPSDDLRSRGFAAGAARFARGEGMWYGSDAIFFACTSGGGNRRGQIWKYTPSSVEGQPNENTDPGILELFVEPNDTNLLEKADNITVAPWGDLFICEDGDGDQYVDVVTPAGEIFKFARNALNSDEFAGSTFSPDGTTLFVNIQKPGMTLAITGPWQETTATRWPSPSTGARPIASLGQAVPNPFVEEVRLPLVIHRQTRPTVIIFDVHGQPVRSFPLGQQEIGVLQITWDGRDDHRRPLPPGTYFAQLRAGSLTMMRKMVKG